MNLLKEVLKHEVYPALGCTEPISIAYAASVAASEIDEPIEHLNIIVDMGTYKNGLAVKVPNTNGERGNLIAAILGALVARPNLKMEILKDVTPEHITVAKHVIAEQRATLHVDSTRKDIYVRVELTTASHSSTCVIARSHTEICYYELDGIVKLDRSADFQDSGKLPYQRELKMKSVSDLIDIAVHIDDEDYAYLSEGVRLNLAISEEGKKLQKVGWYLLDLQRKSYLEDDVLSSTKILTACASDARMEGIPVPAMSSGESGNQGIVAILVPYNVGKYFHID
ncbi:serine dehydratase subunit alpha family protein, partial [candidate division KSB1 bacterium]|nr:serine dehydratase subunit alpha family protein [candidate division KSB1 bacterium]